MKTVIAVLFVVGLVFLAGSMSARAVQINLSSGPEAEGDQAVLEAQARQLNALTDEERAQAAFELEEAKQQAEGKRQAQIDRYNAWQKAGLIGGSFFIFWAFVFGALALSGVMSGGAYHYMIRPIDKPILDGSSSITIPFPMFPFLAIQSWTDAPTASTVYQLGKPPVHTANENLPILAFARLLGADTKGEQRSGKLNIILHNFGMFMENARGLLTGRGSQDDDREE